MLLTLVGSMRVNTTTPEAKQDMRATLRAARVKAGDCRTYRVNRTAQMHAIDDCRPAHYPSGDECAIRMTAAA
jgi:hypothetical protein